jgi:hypothetical protein
MPIPKEDIEQIFAFKDERWICRSCAHTVYRNPHYRGPVGRYKMGDLIRQCQCGSTDWHFTNAPIPSV